MRDKDIDLLFKFHAKKRSARKWLERRDQIEKPYKVKIEPGPNPEKAATRLATYIVNRWMPGNVGGVHIMLTPQLTKSLLPFFQRGEPTTIGVAIIRNRPVIKELPNG